MKEYDVYLPLHHNDGSAIPPEKISRVKRELVEEFGGLTHFPQENEGLWKFGGATFRDKVVILRVITGDPGKARHFFSRLRGRMQQELGQESVLIVERDVEIVPD